MGSPQRPVTLLVAALGGEGGGVLANWIVAAARSLDYPVQSTSIPGVAQRTGATTYYVELFPAPAVAGEHRPLMTLTPAPGNVDVVISSELLEAGRAMLNGYVTPERTTLIASTHRAYTVREKIQMGDGRYDSARVLDAARAIARRALLLDMQSLAAQAGTVVSAVMFGALAGSGSLPLARQACEEAIRRAGRGAEASLRGFALGFSAAEAAARTGRGGANPAQAGRAAAQEEESEHPLLRRARLGFPVQTLEIVEQGLKRALAFQDRRYAELYLDRLVPVIALEGSGGAAADYALTRETARFLALWMCYEDVIRVAQLKTTRSRLEGLRSEVGAKPHEPVHVVEYLKPGLEETAALLPTFLSRRLLAWAGRRGLTDKLNVGMYVRSTGVLGFALLRSLAALRPLRRLTARYAEEQALIERWLAAIVRTGAGDPPLALEIALCARLIKGYGDTHRRGKDNFLRIMDTLVDGDAVTGESERALAVRKAREAALADPEGRALEGSLAAHGITPLAPRPKPIRFMPRPVRDREAA